MKRLKLFPNENNLRENSSIAIKKKGMTINIV
jgi:hypothetical protein